jgi:hypothetical protein
MDLIVILSALVLLLAVLRAMQAVRHAQDDERGSPPGVGYHTLHAEYSSGAGGGHSTTYRVPRDPQEYAKRFVPRDRSRQARRTRN